MLLSIVAVQLHSPTNGHMIFKNFFISLALSHKCTSPMLLSLPSPSLEEYSLLSYLFLIKSKLLAASGHCSAIYCWILCVFAAFILLSYNHTPCHHSYLHE